MTEQGGTIGIVEDDHHYRSFLETLVETTPDLACAFATASIAEALAQYDLLRPDLCLVDLGLLDGNGLELIRRINAANAGRSLVLSVFGDQETVMEAIRAGANGYVLKDMPAQQIVESIRQTLAGFSPISPQVAIYLTRFLTRSRGGGLPGEGELTLTDRETETLSVFARGLSYKEAAEALGVSPHTISDFVKKIYRKLNVHSRSEAVFEAQCLGLIDRPD
ncbi:MAG: response regulator [Pseudomonadota bacterium]